MAPPVVVESQGGRDQSLRPKPGAPGWKEFTRARWHAKHDKKTGITPPKVIATGPPEDPIHALFRSTVEEIKKAATPVDEALIRKPYDEGGQYAIGLGNSAAATGLTNYAKISDQYGKVAGQANTDAAAAGIASGAGPGALSPVQDRYQAQLALQSQAEDAAARDAGNTWAQMLNRVGSMAVGKAQTDRQNLIDSSTMSMWGKYPDALSNRDTLDFQKQSAKDSQDYANALLTEKQAARLASNKLTERGQNVTIRGQNIVSSDKEKDRVAAAKKQAEHDKLTQKGLNTRAAKSAARGIKGLDKVQAALKITPGKDTTEPAGFWGYVQDVSPTGQLYGAVTKIPLKDIRTSQQGQPGGIPNGKRLISSEPKTRKVAGVSTGMTLAQWKKAVGFMYLANKADGMTMSQAEQEVAYITPRPPK